MIYLRFFCLQFIVIFFVACNRENPPTTINGIVTDFKTGLPIANAIIDYGTHSNIGQLGGSGSKKSNTEGKFSITLESDYIFAGFQVNKPNYLTHLDFAGGEVTIEYGKSNDVEFKMRPLDAVIRFNCTNSLPLHDSIYIKVQNNTLTKVIGFPDLFASLGPYDTPIILASGETKESYVKFLSGEMAYIYWGFSQFWKIDEAAFRDSVYLSTGDTAEFQINY